MAEQIPFDLVQENEKPSLIEGAANAHALGALWRDHWTGGKLWISGALASGKTSIGQMFSRKEKAILIDNINEIYNLLEVELSCPIIVDDFDQFAGDEPAEKAFFHLYNAASSARVKLLFLSQKPAQSLDIKLRDLKSRLLTIENVELLMPDDAMTSQLLAKHFQARGVMISPKTIGYMTKRMERSYEAIIAAVNALDEVAKRERLNVNERLAKRYFEGEL